MGTCMSSEPEVDFNSPVDFNHFHILRAIGKGAFGKVCIVKKRDTKQMYAMKYMNKIQIIRKHAVENVFREIKILCSLEHPFLVNLWFTFQDREDMFMVLDLMLGGDISYHLEKHGKFTLPRVKLYMAEVSLALEYLRSKRIIHRDLKPANMLLDSGGHVHLTDFNVATFVRTNVPVTSTTGTRPYMAPEVIQPPSKGYTYSVDWWSLGVSAYEMLRGHRPFVIEKNMTTAALYNLLTHTRPSASVNWDSTTCDVLKMLLHPDDHKRLQTAETMRKHSFFKELNWEEVEQKKAIPPFIPPQNRINCDPTHELEEMIVEPNPLHKKKNRLSKRNVRTEEEAIEVELEKINTKFREYDRQKEKQQKEEKKLVTTEGVEEKSSFERLIEEACSDAIESESETLATCTEATAATKDTSRKDEGRKDSLPAKELVVTAEVNVESNHKDDKTTADSINVDDLLGGETTEDMKQEASKDKGGGETAKGKDEGTSETAFSCGSLSEDSKPTGEVPEDKTSPPSEPNSVQDTSGENRTVPSPSGSIEGVSNLED